MSGKIVHLTEKPSTFDIYARAVRSALPVIGSRADHVPETTFVLSDRQVDTDHLAAYDRATGLRFGDALPLTYPFTLVFPVVMKLMVSEGFPFPVIGSVHTENVIERFRRVSVSEPLESAVHAENLREHRKGLLVDLISEIRVEREVVWRQTSTFLRQQKTSLSDQPGPAPKPEQVPPPPLRTLRVDQNVIDRYAAVSGDRNPIHLSSWGARAFGFPRTIAHGMWSAAAVLGSVEGRIPDAVTYRVRFGKPIFLPSTVNVYADRTSEGWDLALRHPKKGYPYLTATLRQALR